MSDNNNNRSQNIKKALDQQAKDARGSFLQEGIAGLEEQRAYWNLSKNIRDKYDDIARAELEAVGVKTHKKGGKKQRTNKNKKNKNKKSRRVR